MKTCNESVSTAHFLLRWLCQPNDRQESPLLLAVKELSRSQILARRKGASQYQQMQSNVNIGALTNTGITACNNIDFASQADRSRDLPNDVLESVQVR